MTIGTELEVGSGGFANHGEAFHDPVDLGQRETAVPHIGVRIRCHEINVELELGKSFGAAGCHHFFPGIEVGDISGRAAVEVDFNLIAKTTAEKIVGGGAERFADEVTERDFDATDRPDWRPPWCGGGRAKWHGVHAGCHLAGAGRGGVGSGGAIEHFGDDRVHREYVPTFEVGVQVFDTAANTHEVVAFPEAELPVVGVDPNDDFGNFGFVFAADAVFTGTAEAHHSNGGDFHDRGFGITPEYRIVNDREF